MPRRLFTLLSALSLLLCIAMAVLCVRSHLAFSSITWNRQLNDAQVV